MSDMHYIRQCIEDSLAVKQKVLDDQALLDRLQQVAEVCIHAFRRGNKVMLAGNGGSAADAQHIAAEFVSRFDFDRPGIPSLALSTDTSMLTAIGNDYGYEHVFRRQVQAQGREGDVLIGISTSGNSRNVVLAVEEARRMGIVTVALTGAKGILPELCDHALQVPATHTPRIQENHILLGHILCGYVEAVIFADVKQPKA
ncbi:MAG: D-sedoheptulose 7-phosphate isomerase [Pseudomonadales bacterium]|nr:D-sedoheptulose 7-phosphate isomerase [Pseudomonadales bacterium]